MLPRLQVVARSSPTDKYILVEALMKLGEIVAVTGDGTNDAPALTLADVGFAMKTGTEVAKGAADMVLMDDNFASVVNATRWGRTVNDNIRKFLQFQLTINLVGVLLTFIGSAMSDEGESPLKPVQLLWLNLIMDTLAALCLATERPSWECLDRAPVFRSAPLISRTMWVFIIGHATWQLMIVIVLMVKGHIWFSVGECLKEDGKFYSLDGDGVRHCKMGKEHCTVVFNTFILMQLVNQWNARKLYKELNPFSGLMRNKLMVYLFPIIVGIQVLAVQLEVVMRDAMQTYPLNGGQWGGCIIIALFELPIGLALKGLSQFVVEYKPPSNAVEKPETKKEGLEVIRVRVDGDEENTQR
jgi:magnesium-transporting ATPase (P-type)